MPLQDLHDRESGAVDQPGKTLLIEFYTEWCPTCRAMKQSLERFSEERPDIEIFTVNADENPGFVSEYGIKSVPTFIAKKDGKVTSRTAGAVSRHELENMVAAEAGALR